MNQTTLVACTGALLTAAAVLVALLTAGPHRKVTRQRALIAEQLRIIRAQERTVTALEQILGELARHDETARRLVEQINSQSPTTS